MSTRACAFPLALLVLACCAGLAIAQTTTPAARPPATTSAPSPAPAPPAASAPSPDTATGVAAWERLKGNTITGKVSGQEFSEFFDAGGGVRYVDRDGLSTGTWAVQNAKVCFDFPDDDDRSCSSFTVSGTTGSAVDDDGVTTRFEIQPGNAKGL